jgi:hypothetical protein
MRAAGERKSFSVQQFFKNAAEVWASSPHLRSKLDFASWQAKAGVEPPFAGRCRPFSLRALFHVKQYSWKTICV